MMIYIAIWKKADLGVRKMGTIDSVGSNLKMKIKTKNLSRLRKIWGLEMYLSCEMDKLETTTT